VTERPRRVRSPAEAFATVSLRRRPGFRNKDSVDSAHSDVRRIAPRLRGSQLRRAQWQRLNLAAHSRGNRAQKIFRVGVARRGISGHHALMMSITNGTIQSSSRRRLTGMFLVRANSINSCRRCPSHLRLLRPPQEFDRRAQRFQQRIDPIEQSMIFRNRRPSLPLHLPSSTARILRECLVESNE